MADGQNGSGEVKLADVELALGRIPSVSAARVVTGPGGKITEVHVLAGRDRGPKQVVRDVQSVAKASFGIDIDYRTVSVVQLEDPTGIASQPTATQGVAPTNGTRVELARVGSEFAGSATQVNVSLKRDGRDIAGTARGPASAGLSLVARATIEAVGHVLDDTVGDVGAVDVVAAGGNEVALCVLHLGTPDGDRTVTGAAIVRRDRPEAVARATLDGLNRVLGEAAHGEQPDESVADRPGGTA